MVSQPRQPPALPLVALPFFGVQSVWSTEMAFASPYLISLGLPKSLMALVFLAGPFSGLIVQPLVGSWADSSQSRFGRRRPFMITGSLITASAMLLLGFGKPLAGLFLSGNAYTAMTITLAVFAIYAIDFSINGVMAVSRAFLVDVLPPALQDNANAWASALISIGNVVGFFIGNLNLPNLLPWLGSTQLQVISCIASTFLIGTNAITAWNVREKPFVPQEDSTSPTQSVWARFSEIYHHWRSMPDTVRAVCNIGFFTWLASFPVMFYTTLFIGNRYRDAAPSPTSPTLDEDASRAGSRALFWSAVIALITTIVAPRFLERQKEKQRRTASLQDTEVNVALINLWALSHGVFAVCMLFTAFVQSVGSATIVFAVGGFTYAVNHWAPYALIGEAILHQTRHERERTPSVDEEHALLDEGQSKPPSAEAGNAGIILGIHNLYVVAPQFVIIALSSVIFALFESQPGVVPSSALHNSSLLGSLSGPPQGEGKSVDSVTVIFQIAGLSSATAMVMTMKLSRKLRQSALTAPSNVLA